MSSEIALKESRTKCYLARDLFLACFDKNGNNASACRKEFRTFERDCPTSWVGHFVRKHKFEKYKEQLAKEGFLPEDEKHAASKN